MTTVRLNILAAAAALGEFTAPELRAYTGADPSTVRQVLFREQAARNLFERSRSGRAVVWRLKDVDAILDEIADEEGKLAALRSPGDSPEHAIAGGMSHTERLLATAEDSVIRAYETKDPAEQRTLARIAMNLLQAVDPEADQEGTGAPDLEWWEGKPAVSWHMTQSWNLSFQNSTFGLNGSQTSESLSREPYKQQARRIASFASLATRRVDGETIEPEHLRRAAETISESRSVLGLAKTKGWIRRLVSVLIDHQGYLPPIAVMTGREQSPADLFPVARGHWSSY